MREIRCAEKIDAVVRVPGSKSYSHRTAIAAALSDGICHISNYLNSDDTNFTLGALEQLGIIIENNDDNLLVHGRGGNFDPGPKSVYLGNSGTSMRLLTAVAALGPGPYEFSGTSRMHERPVGELVSALRQIGVFARTVKNNGCPPVVVRGGKIAGKTVSVDCGKSSQYLSGLLLMAPCTQNGLEITVTRGPVSRPYVEMTLDIMSRFGIACERQGYTVFRVPGGQSYAAGKYAVEPDCSQAGYFWAAAAICRGRVKVAGIGPDTRQGDVRFVEILEKMGCRINHEADGISVTGAGLSAVDADMADMPDLVPTLAVVAAFAEGTTIIRNVAHLREKESDRLAAVSGELQKMGIHAQITGDGLSIRGGIPRGAPIDTHDDHRIAMSFAVAGLAVPGILISDPGCVEKSFPGFWEVFERLYST